MDRALLVVVAALGGGLIAVQAPVNARLRVAVGSPLLSATISFVIGTAILMVAVMATDGFGGLAHSGRAPWWAWVGGLAGAVLVTATLIAVPRLGATTTFVAVISGQVAVAAVIDRFGWFGLPTRVFTPGRLVAIVLMVIALLLLVRD